MHAARLRPGSDAASRAARHASAAFLVWMAVTGIVAWFALFMLH